MHGNIVTAHGIDHVHEGWRMQNLKLHNRGGPTGASFLCYIRRALPPMKELSCCRVGPWHHVTRRLQQARVSDNTT